jgi:hypothetical protein
MQQKVPSQLAALSPGLSLTRMEKAQAIRRTTSETVLPINTPGNEGCAKSSPESRQWSSP